MKHSVLNLLANRCYKALNAHSVPSIISLLDKKTADGEFPFEENAQYKAFAKQIAALKFPVAAFKELIQQKLEYAFKVQTQLVPSASEPAQTPAPEPVDVKRRRIEDALTLSLAPLGSASLAPADVKRDPMSVVRLAQQPFTGFANAIRSGEATLEMLRNPNAKDETGTPLCVLAATYGQVGVLAKLAKAGADLNAKDQKGQSALYVVTYHGVRRDVALAMFDILLAHNVEGSDDLWTHATHSNNSTLASLLVEHGIDPVSLFQGANLPSQSPVVKLAKAFVQATEGHVACSEFKNQHLVTRLEAAGLPTTFEELRVRNGVADNDPNTVHYPMHVASPDAKFNAIDLHELKMPDGTSAFTYVQRALAKITTSPLPARVKASAVAVALAGTLPKQDALATDEKGSDLAAAEFVLECRNKRYEERPYLCVTWPTSSSDMKDVRVEWIRLQGQSTSGCIGGATHLFVDQKQASATAKAITKGYVAREVPNHIVNEQLAARLNANGAHAIFIEMRPEPQPVVSYSPYSFPLYQTKGLGGAGAALGRSAGESYLMGVRGTAPGIAKSTAAAAGAGAGAMMGRGLSAYAVVDNGAAIADNRQSSALGYNPILSDIHYFCTGALVVNTAGLSNDEQLKYTNSAATERYKALMEARSSAIQAQLALKPRYSAANALSQLKSLNCRDNQQLGELEVLLGRATTCRITDYGVSELYSDALFISINGSSEDAKALSAAINRMAGCNLATYDSSRKEPKIYLDATLFVEFIESKAKRFNAMFGKHEDIVRTVMQIAASREWNAESITCKTDLFEAGFLRAHGCKDLPTYAQTNLGDGENNDKVTINLRGIPFAALEAVAQSVNAVFSNAAKVSRTEDATTVQLTVSFGYLESAEYLRRYQAALTALFVGSTGADRDFLDTSFKAVGMIDQTLRECMSSLYQAVGVTVAADTFVACIHKLMVSVSPLVNEVPDVKQIQANVAEVRKQMSEYKALSAAFFKRNDPALSSELLASLDKAGMQNSTLNGVEHALENIEKRFALKK